MKKPFLASITMLCYGYAAMAQKTVTIKGNVKGDLKGHNKIFIYGNGVKSDSTVMYNGNFEFTIPFEKEFVPLVYDEYSRNIARGFAIFPILIDRPGVVDIKDIEIEKGMPSGTITGMQSAEEFQAFSRQQLNIMAEADSLLKKKYGVNILVKRVSEVRDSVMNQKLPLIIEKLVKSYPDSYASVFILENMGMESMSTDNLERIYGLLSKNRQQSIDGEHIADYLKGIRNSGLGNYVPDFTLNDAEDKAFNFSKLKGKYVLIDFWASWCGPCKISFPFLKEIYKKYKSDSFEIYSISIDKSKPDWLKELKAQDLPWLQSLDTKNIASSSFAVTAVPTSYLIDPDGKIIMKEVGFDPDGAMKKKLKELFGNKASN